MNTKRLMQLIQVSALSGLVACGGDNEPASGSDSTDTVSTAFATGIPTELAATPTQCRAARVSKITDEVLLDTDVFDSEYSVSGGRFEVAALLDGPESNYCSVPSRQYVESMLNADQLTYIDDGSIEFSSPPATTIWSATVAQDGTTHYEWNTFSVRGVRNLKRLVVGPTGEFRSCRNYSTGLTHSEVSHCGEGLETVIEATREDQ